ncbi:caspase recruitment domain-containing protein 8-like isoform X1 [Lates japonicus]|uniref:Caspase recruitment domain-containing protein 8-like isoform X1 n=1 Tax=Lates japonicus TaxID=270547 RepID=A0AAD3NBE3_LATJO|nr:caspase recruitment domain-containing protein 8-like isoform X1 [Lates japonicus]
MSREGKLSFRVAQVWDEQLLQAAGKVPAGPLFDIKCPEDAVSQLQPLPHCETTPVLPSDGLSVVHISDHGMSILDPQEITETHVVVDVLTSLPRLENVPLQESALFDLKYGPNYHPTFEIRLKLGTEEATVTVQDQEKKLVWEYNVDLTGPDLHKIYQGEGILGEEAALLPE